MDIPSWFGVLGFGAVAGAVGQTIRVVAGLKKLNDSTSGGASAVADQIDVSRLIISLVLGAVAGMLLAPTVLFDAHGSVLANVPMEKFFALATAGYAGADFIETFIRRVAPGTSGDPPPASPGTASDGTVG